MIADMPRPRPPHLHRETTRHGKAEWYVRVGKRPRIRFKSQYGAPQCDADYQAAINGERPVGGNVARTGSLEWLIARYREAPTWLALSLATRRQRENILRQVAKSAGREPYGAITERTIIAGRDRRAALQRKPSISSAPSGAFSFGRKVPVSSKPIRLPMLNICGNARRKASRFGRNKI